MVRAPRTTPLLERGNLDEELMNDIANNMQGWVLGLEV